MSHITHSITFELPRDQELLDWIDARTEAQFYVMFNQVVLDTLRSEHELHKRREALRKVRLTALIASVMEDAYKVLGDGAKISTVMPPWDRLVLYRRILYSIGDVLPVGDTLADQVQPWLKSHQVIIDGQVNLAAFPDLNSFLRFLSANPPAD